jgi:succinate dehydrogenase cytochrome b556 subunit/succinate dehydrogenase hydrophobic membrane anchor protein
MSDWIAGAAARTTRKDIASMASVVSERPGSNFSAGLPGFDRFVWYFFRVSGLMLVLLAGGHLFITHYLNVPSETTFDFVANRWANPLWRLFDFLLLLMALWHGLFGMRTVIIDWVKQGGWRVALTSTTWVIGLIFTAMGTITIFTFDEEAARNNTGPLAGEMWIADVIGFSLFAFAIVTYVVGAALLVYILRHIRLGTRPIYSGDLGQYAWVMHRATGLGILFFLLIHIIDIMLVGLGRDIYDETVHFYANPFLIPMEIALVGAVIYHTLNGLRIMLIDFWARGAKLQKPLFYAAIIGTILLTIPSAIIIIRADFL